MKASCGHEVEVFQYGDSQYTHCSAIRWGRGYRHVCPECGWKNTWKRMSKAGKGAVEAVPLSRLYVYRDSPDPIVNAAPHKRFRTWSEPPDGKPYPSGTRHGWVKKDDYSGFVEVSSAYHVIAAKVSASRGKHNWGCHRYDCTFPMPDGFMWYGRMIGENGYMRCWRTKEKVSA